MKLLWWIHDITRPWAARAFAQVTRKSFKLTDFISGWLIRFLTQLNTSVFNSMMYLADLGFFRLCLFQGCSPSPPPKTCYIWASSKGIQTTNESLKAILVTKTPYEVHSLHQLNLPLLTSFDLSGLHCLNVHTPWDGWEQPLGHPWGWYAFTYMKTLNHICHRWMVWNYQLQGLKFP